MSRHAAAPRLRPADIDRHESLIGIALVASVLIVCPAAAQVGASVAIYSEQRARGEATSGGRPVAVLDVSYDHPDGPYLGGSLTGVATARSGVRLLDTSVYAGIAHRLKSGATIDAGVIDTRYSEYGGSVRSAGYAEAYVGLSTRNVSTRLHFSPGYYRRDVSTLYAEIDGVLDPLATWRIGAHLGALAQVSGPTDQDAPFRYDWRIAVQRRFGRFDARVAATGGGPPRDRDRYRPTISRRPAIVLGVRCIF